MNNLANFLTFSSLACGFISIVFSLESQFTFSAWSIMFSVIFDGLDGQVARRNPIPSDFGKELDSLVDVVCFGIAPAVLGYVFIYRDFYLWAILALFFYLFCSVFRLAKYNITPKEEMSNYFYGLPTTVSGGVLASFMLIFRRIYAIGSPFFVRFIFMFLVLVLAFLMISKVRYLNLEGVKKFLGKRLSSTIFIVVIIFIIAASFKKAGVTLFIFFLFYLIFSPVVVKRITK